MIEKTNLSRKLFKLLNDQYNREIASAYKYLDFAAVVYAKAMFNYSEFLYKSGMEELAHADRFYKLIRSVGFVPRSNDLIVPQTEETKEPIKIAEFTYENEVLVTSYINEIKKCADEENNYIVQEFIDWFINEQVEEEEKTIKIIDFFKLSNDLILIDHKIGEIDKFFKDQA